MKPEKDLIIVGGGAAGLSAAQYGARANLSVALIEEMALGGQAIIIDTIENYPAIPNPITGYLFAQAMEEQTIRFGAEIVSDTVKSIQRTNDLFTVETYSRPYTAYSVIFATGAKHKKLGIEGEDQFSGKGVSYCATCDGPFFKNKKMLIVGGGDSACDEAMFLSKLSDKIILVHRKDRLRAQQAIADRVLTNPNIEVRFNTELKAISGDNAVKQVRIFNNKENREYTEDVSVVFIFIGSIPQTALVVKSGVEFDDAGYIVTNQCMETKVKGMYAVGDIRTTPFRQLIVAASDGAIAAHCASQYIDELKGLKYL
jgi:thioredoxin reductase (NADPH)